MTNHNNYRNYLFNKYKKLLTDSQVVETKQFFRKIWKLLCEKSLQEILNYAMDGITLIEE